MQITHRYVLLLCNICLDNFEPDQTLNIFRKQTIWNVFGLHTRQKIS